MNAYTCTFTKPCSHDNGWYETVRIWTFKKELFFCADCRSAVPAIESRQEGKK